MNFPAEKMIGLGLAALGRPAYINLGHSLDIGENKSIGDMQSKAHEVLDAAWAAGIRYFDAARSYGKAEDFLSSWIAKRTIAPKAIFVSSKWGYRYTGNWQVESGTHEVKEHSIEMLKQQIGESSELLADHLNLYQVHSATLESGVLENSLVLDELARLKNNGLSIGITLSGPKQAETLARAMEITRNGEMLFDAVQATWNILETSTGQQLQMAHDEGMRVIVKEALANGRLTSRNQSLNFKESKARLEDIAKKYQTTIDALSIAAALAQDWVNVVLSGAATVPHLESNLAALSLRMKRDDLHKLEKLAEPAQQYWKFRAGLNWN